MAEEIQQTPQPQAGMSENALFGLAYVTVIPAIIFLVTAPYNQNPKVRFHSWQSIFLGIAWVVVWIVLTILGMIPGIRYINILLVPVVALAFMIVWLVVMINGFMGKTIKLPFLGAVAAKQAGM